MSPTSRTFAPIASMTSAASAAIRSGKRLIPASGEPASYETALEAQQMLWPPLDTASKWPPSVSRQERAAVYSLAE